MYSAWSKSFDKTRKFGRIDPRPSEGFDLQPNDLRNAPEPSLATNTVNGHEKVCRQKNELSLRVLAKARLTASRRRCHAFELNSIRWVIEMLGRRPLRFVSNPFMPMSKSMIGGTGSRGAGQNPAFWGVFCITSCRNATISRKIYKNPAFW